MRNYTYILYYILYFLVFTAETLDVFSIESSILLKDSQVDSIPEVKYESVEDSLWNNFENLNAEDLELDNSIKEADYSYYFSSGWFPGITNYEIVHGIVISFGGIYDDAFNLRSNSFAPTKYPFKSGTDIDPDDLMIYGKNSFDEGENAEFSSYFSFGYEFKFGLGINLPFRFATGMIFQTGILYSEDNSKKYLTNTSELKDLKELNVLLLNETALFASLGFEIPFYGAFVSVPDGNAYSFYTLFFNCNVDYYFSSSADQYIQIINAKKDLRYRSGCDTLQYFTDRRLNTLENLRFSSDIGLGMPTNAFGFGVNMELFLNIPWSSIITDGNWRQYKLLLKFVFNFK